jgi:hypothetical protein
MHIHRAIAAACLLTLSFTAGCRIESKKQGNGDNVKIATPFGGMSVKTDDAAVQQSTGLPPYPGAMLVKNDKDKGAADIDFAFGSFQLRVKAVSYRTPDAPDDVAAFYRKALGHFGDVIQCSHDKPVGSPVRTAEGLTCDDQKNKHIDISDKVPTDIELKAGSKVHQHIVEISPEGSGTKFGLVALDLPSHVTLGDDKDDTRQ